MKAENWEKINRITVEALEINKDHRQDFIARCCSGKPEIQHEVESLLTGESEAEKFFGDFSLDHYADLFQHQTASEPLAGQQIGNYKIIREIGTGGMGAVYLAERSDGKFAQQAALKFLRRELNTEKIRLNFQREKEILAALSHPNIARLLDTGTTRDGIPYLVMEYIEGEPIDEYCRNRGFSLHSRLKLFNKVCDAVGFAHRHLIVHRDLKPSNIIVTTEGIPKLLDFGISKLLDTERNKTEAVTILGAMTLEYAAPEQIRGENVTTAADIYSLGVILFELLTGKLPHKIKNGANEKFFREISETEPAYPSRKISSQDESSKMITSAQLKGDLDNIVLKALSKEAARRYPTAEQFSADIWRFIDGKPVTARPATLTYRAQKFFQRNRAAVVAAGLVLASLIAGIAVSVRQTNVAREQALIASEARNYALAETEKAKAEQAKAEKITRFMTKIIGYGNPLWYGEGAKLGKNARVIDVINDLSGKIDAEFADEPDVAAELHHKFVEAISTNAGNERTEEQKAKILFHARRALELRKQFYGERHELIAKDMLYLYWAGAIEEKDKPRYLMAAIQMMRETNPHNLNLPYMLEDFTARLILPRYEHYHEQYRQAAFPQNGDDKYKIAEQMLRESLPIFREHYKPDNLAILSAECKLAYILAMQNKMSDFGEHYGKCRESGEHLEKDIKLLTESIEKHLTKSNREMMPER